MSEQIVEVEADSLEEAREKVRSQIPEGLRLLSEEVISDGNPKTLHGVADTIEGAFEQGLSRIPPSASIVQKEVTVSPTVQTMTVEAFDEQTAMRLVEQRVPPYAKIIGLVLKTQGRKGFLGIGKRRPDCYEAQILPMAIVEITYKEKVKIRATIGEKVSRERKPSVKRLKREKDVEGLISALQYVEDADVRADAAFALGDIGGGDERALDPLIRALKDDYFLVAVGAARALGVIKDAGAVEPLIQTMLNHKTPTARGNAAVALGEIRDARAVEPLIQTLREDGVPEVRERAAWALREIKDSRAIGPLIQALKDEDWDVRGEAASALSDIGEPAVQPLIEALKDKDSDIRWGAASALGHMGNKMAIGPLTQALRDESPNVRGEAARAIEMIEKSKEKEGGEEKWKVHEDGRYKVSFAYPGSWTMKRYQTGTLGFLDPNTDVHVEFEVEKNFDQESLQDYLEEHIATFKSYARLKAQEAGLDKRSPKVGLLDEKGITVSGTEGRILIMRLFYQGEYWMHVHLCMLTSRNVFLLRCITPDRLYGQYEDTFDRILRSFVMKE